MVVVQRQMLGRPLGVSPRRPILAHLEVTERIDVIRELALRHGRIVHERRLTRIGESDVARVEIRVQNHLLTDGASQVARRPDRLPRHDPVDLISRAPVAECRPRDGDRRGRFDPIEAEEALQRILVSPESILLWPVGQATQTVQADELVDVPSAKISLETG